MAKDDDLTSEIAEGTLESYGIPKKKKPETTPPPWQTWGDAARWEPPIDNDEEITTTWYEPRRFPLDLFTRGNYVYLGWSKSFSRVEYVYESPDGMRLTNTAHPEDVDMAGQLDRENSVPFDERHDYTKHIEIMKNVKEKKREESTSR